MRLYGADNPDRLRGLFLDGVVMDEFGDMTPGAWRSVIRPALSDREGWAVFIGTPKGRNEFFDVHSHAQKNPEKWYSLTLRADESRIIAEGELLDAQAQMTPEQYAQEYLCSFDAAIVGAYFGKTIAEIERLGHIVQVERVAGIPIQTAWDLGIGDSTAIWVFQCIGSEIRVLDCFENSGFGLEWYAEELRRRSWLKPDTINWLPHDARVRDLSTGRSRVEFLQSMGLRCDLVPNLGLEDGINAARLMLPQAFFDSRTTGQGVEALRQYRAAYDEKTKAFSNKPRHDWTSHYADAFRYLCVVARQLAKPERPSLSGRRASR